MKVKFLPMNIELPIRQGQSVMNLAHENNIPIKSVCNGMPSCAECRVRVVDGDWNLLPPSTKETSLIGTGYYIDQRRLSCQLQCFGDITVDLTEQVEKASESNVSKKFLARTDKESADELHAVGGIFLEQEKAIVDEVSVSAKETEPAPQRQPQQPRERNQQNQKSNQPFRRRPLKR